MAVTTVIAINLHKVQSKLKIPIAVSAVTLINSFSIFTKRKICDRITIRGCTLLWTEILLIQGSY